MHAPAASRSFASFLSTGKTLCFSVLVAVTEVVIRFKPGSEYEEPKKRRWQPRLCLTYSVLRIIHARTTATPDIRHDGHRRNRYVRNYDGEMLSEIITLAAVASLELWMPLTGNFRLQASRFGGVRGYIWSRNVVFEFN